MTEGRVTSIIREIKYTEKNLFDIFQKYVLSSRRSSC